MKNSTSNMNILFYLIFLILGLTLSYFGIKQYQATRNIMSVGIETDAVIVEFTERDSDGPVFTPVFEYVGKSGTIKSSGKVAYAKPPFDIGDSARIVYDPVDEKEFKVLSFWGLYLWPIIFFSFAPPFLLIGGGYFLFKFG